MVEQLYKLRSSLIKETSVQLKRHLRDVDSFTIILLVSFLFFIFSRYIFSFILLSLCPYKFKRYLVLHSFRNIKSHSSFWVNKHLLQLLVKDSIFFADGNILHSSEQARFYIHKYPVVTRSHHECFYSFQTNHSKEEIRQVQRGGHFEWAPVYDCILWGLRHHLWLALKKKNSYIWRMSEEHSCFTQATWQKVEFQ